MRSVNAPFRSASNALAHSWSVQKSLLDSPLDHPEATGSDVGVRRRLCALLRVVVLLSGFLAACGGSGASTNAPSVVVATTALGEPRAVLELAMRDLAFDKQTLESTAGDVVELRLTNRGTLTHDFTIDRIPADVQPVRVDGRFGDGHSAVHVALDGGKSAAIRLRANAPGEYTYYCSVSGHRQAGMEGKLVVR
jgi:uncharacterized cupredoxin-like copper-binding protein